MKRIILLCLGLFIFSSCEDTDPFQSYRGANLISTRGFDDSGWQTHMSDTLSLTYADYMGFGSAGTVDGKEAYRLEIKNLFPDGMMETAADPAPGWTTTPAVNPSIAGGELSYTLTALEQTDFDLTTNLLNSADFTVNLELLMIFDFMTTNNYVYNKLIAGTEINDPIKVQTPAIGSTSDPLIFSQETGKTIHLRLGSTAPDAIPQTGNTLDNLRVALFDGDYKLRIRLPYSSSVRPDLIPGTYRLSFKVKDDPAAGTGDRFASSSVSFGFIRLTGTYGASATGTGPWTEWTTVTHDFVESAFPQTEIPASGDTETIELWISPGSPHTTNLRPGSLLIAEPSLVFLPDGA